MRSGSILVILLGRAPVGALLVAWCAVAAGAAVAEAYVLRPGDVVRVAILGLPDASMDVPIDVDGQVRIPRVGAVDAAGRTLDELEGAVRARAEGVVIKRLAQDATPVFLTLDGADVFVTIGSYHPLYVTGAVARPGEVPFRPGMTVRAALSAVGGVAATVAPVGVDPTRETARLQAEYRSFAVDHSAQLARLWRIDAELALSADLPTPDLASFHVAPGLAQEMLRAQHAQVVAALAAREAELTFFKSAAAQAEERIEILNRQVVNQREGVADDEEEQKRTNALLARGVVQMSRVLESRRAVLLSSSRLLDSENDLARVRLELESFRRQSAVFDEQRAVRLGVERETARQRRLEAEARLASSREQLAAIGVAPAAPGASGVPETLVSLHRRDALGAESIWTARLDEVVEPGDMLEVMVVTSLTSAGQ